MFNAVCVLVCVSDLGVLSFQLLVDLQRRHYEHEHVGTSRMALLFSWNQPMRYSNVPNRLWLITRVVKVSLPLAWRFSTGFIPVCLLSRQRDKCLCK